MLAVEFLKKFFIYGVGNIVASAPPFILMPYLTGKLSPAEFGEQSYYETLSVILMPVLMLGIDGYYSSNHFKYKNKTALLRILFMTPLVMLVVTSVLCFSYCAIYTKLTEENIDYINILYLLSLLLQGVTMNAIITYLQSEIQAWSVFFLKIFYGIINIGSCIFFIETMNDPYSSKIYGSINAALLCCMLFFIIAKYKKILFGPQLYLDEVYRVTKSGIPFVIHALTALVFFWADRIIIKLIEGPERLGIYMVAMQISLSMSLVLNAFGQIWTPVAFNLLEARDINRFLKFSRVALVVLVLIGICLALMVNPIYNYLINLKYIEYKEVAYFGIITFVMLGVYRIYSIVLFHSQNISSISMATAIAAISNLLATYIVVSTIGSYYAGLATLFVCSVYSVWISKISIKKLNEEYC